MAKQRRNITISAETDEQLDQTHVNASGLIEDLVAAYFAYGSVDESVAYAAEKRSQDRERRLRDVVETLADRDDVDELDRFNDAIMTQAGRLETRPEELVELVERYVDDGDLPEEVIA